MFLRLNQILFASMALLWASLIGSAQDNSFYRKYNMGGMQGGLHLEATSDGGFVATGQHEGNGSAGGCDVYVYRVDECGNIVWFKLFGTGSSEGGKSIVETADGGYLVSGNWAGNIGFGMRLSPNGDLLWLRTFPGTDFTFYASELNDGSAIFAGRNAGAPVFIRTNANGDVIWAKRITSIGEMPLYIAQGADDAIYYYSSYLVPGYAMVAGKLDLNGNIIWSKGFGAGWVDSDHTAWSGRGFFDFRDSTFVVTSPITNQGFGGEDVFLMKLNANDGTPIWSKAIGTTGSDQSRDICATDLGYGIIGNTNGAPFTIADNPDLLSSNMSERDVLLIHTDMDGNEIYTRTYGATGRDKGIGIRFNTDQTFTISAYTGSPFFGNGDASMDPLFIKTDTLGIVSCQTGFPLFGFMDVTVNSGNIGSASDFALTSSPQNPNVNEIVPLDTYQCQFCYTEPAFQPSDTLVCVGQPVEFYNTTSVGLTCFQEWTINNQAFPGFLDTLTYVFNEPGVYTTQLFSTCGGAEQTYEINIHVHEVVIDQVVTSDYNGFEVSCPQAADGSIQVSVSGGYFLADANYIFEWSNDLEPGLQQLDLTEGEYSVIVRDDLGCSASATVALAAPPPLVLDASILSNYNSYDVSCFQSIDAQLSANGLGGSGGLTYLWEGNILPPNNLQTVTAGAGAISLTLSDQNGCTTATEILVNEPSPLVLALETTTDFNGFNISCFGFADGAVEFDASGSVSPYTFASGGDVWNDVLTLGSLPAGDFMLQVNDANGCNASAAILLTQPEPIAINPTVVSNYNGAQISCTGADDAQTSVNPLGGVAPFTILWEDGAQGSLSFVDLGPGYTHVSVVDLNGCTAFDSVFIVEPSPVIFQSPVLPNYNGYEVPCHGATQSDLPLAAAGGTGAYTYFANGAEVDNVIQNLGAGIYALEVQDANGCADTLTVVFNEPDPLVCESVVTSNYNGYNVSCHGFNDGSAEVATAGGVAPYTYNWSNQESTGTAIALSAGASEVLITDLNGCTTQCSVILTEPLPLALSLSVVPDTCARAVGRLSLNPQGGVYPHGINWDADVEQSPSGFSLFGLGEGAYPFELTDLNGCILRDTALVGEHPGPVLDVRYRPNPACTETEVTLGLTSDKELVSATWLIDDRVYQGSEAAHVFYTPGYQTFQLLVEDIHACRVDTSLTLLLLPGASVYIPNAFTPDNDGVNDYFAAVAEGLEYFEMKIFDRWGVVIYESYDVNSKWDGSYRGGDYYAMPGAYSYIVRVSGPCHRITEHSGSVILIR